MLTSMSLLVVFYSGQRLGKCSLSADIGCRKAVISSGKVLWVVKLPVGVPPVAQSNNRYRIEGHTIRSSKATYFYYQAFVKNLENNITLSNVGPSGDFNTGTATFADPRLVGVRFGYKFQ